MIDIEDISPEFSFVAEMGLVTDLQSFQPEAFGNTILIMVGSPFSLRFERDRGQVFVDVGNDMVGWYKLEYVIEFIDNSFSQKQLGEPPSTFLLSMLLRSKWDEIKLIFSSKDLISQLQMFSMSRSNNLLANIFRVQ